MKREFGILFLLAFAIGGVFFACSNYDENPAESSSSGGLGHSSNSNNSIISSSSDNPVEISSSSAAVDILSSSSNLEISSSSASSSSIATTPSSSSSSVGTSSSVVVSSSSSVSSTPTCAYQTTWCGGAAASAVKTASLNNATGSGICTFATSATMLGNSNSLTVNGTKINNCGNTGWGQKACTEVLGSVAKADGGYYIYAPDYYADFTVTGGTPSCNGSNPNPPIVSSSSSATPGGTSSSAGNSGTPSYTPTAPGTETSKITHYWDACKPSCSWSSNAGGKPANACNITGGNIGHNDSDRSACDGANAFMCMNNAPWKVGNVSFGYVAGNIGKCGDCYQFDFPNGQVMVVMANNHGAIHDGAKFDLMIPGGGVGDFNALTRQVTNSGVSNPDMGVQYGGFRGKCGWTHSTANVNCVEKMCNDVFKNLPDLKAGCLWYVETLGRAPGSNNASWDNPTVKYKLVTCPKELTDRY
jgi:hypothetical protein